MSERFVVFVESKDTCNLYDEETHCFMKSMIVQEM